jgi:hypothetical protein
MRWRGESESETQTDETRCGRRMRVALRGEAEVEPVPEIAPSQAARGSHRTRARGSSAARPLAPPPPHAALRPHRRPACAPHAPLAPR